MKNERIPYFILILISVIVPSVVALLLFTNSKTGAATGWISFLPHFHAAVNALTVILLIAGYTMIRLKRIRWHRMIMTTAFIMGILFLISYIIYHSSAPPAVFGDANHDGFLDINEAGIVGNTRNIYLLILLSHIVLAALVVPFVLFAFYFALTGKFNHHKKIVKFALPVWLYVSITGVIVYLMISPYY